MLAKARARAQDWYWPLRIEVLGGSNIYLDGEPLALGNRTSELLLALASLGDGENWVDRNRLADVLWPDSDGDRAQRALDTPIHRLRRLLGSEAMIMTRPGAVALDPGLCYVDYWWLPRSLANQEQREPADVALWVDAVVKLSRAALSGSSMLPLESLMRRIVLKVLDALNGPLCDAPEAEQWLETLLGAMPEHERLWQALIRLYVDRGLNSAAIEAWQRCRTALLERTGAEPSAATRSLIDSL